MPMLPYILCALSLLGGPAALQVDLDADGTPERLVLDASQDPALSVRHGEKLLWEGVPARWKPWKMLTADVDGDGRREVVLGVHKATRYWPEPHNCLFVYGWDGKQLYPRWLGSRLSKPFTDFAFAQIDGEAGDDLLSIETTREGRQCAVLYTWCGFGFEGVWQQGSWKRARLLPQPDGKVAVEADGRRYRVTREGVQEVKP